MNENNNEKKKLRDEAFKQLAEENKLEINKPLGEGGFGLVYEVKYKGRTYAAKLIEKESVMNNETDILTEFRGPNIVKVNKFYSGIYKNKEYYIILMEKASLKSLKKFIFNLKDLLNIISKKSFEFIGDNLLRFYIKQIVQGLEIINRYGYSHFDIKPDNILLFLGMVAKITDFGLSTKIEEGKGEVHIPGGTRGYLTPEYYKESKVNVSPETALKQDYFALGATIYYFIFGERMLDYSEYILDRTMNYNLLIDLIQKAMDKIKSKKLANKDFVEFLCSLINYRPEERPNLEEIYRNKWLNENTEEIENISLINTVDERKLLIELDKSDYLLEIDDKLKKKKGNNIKKFPRHKFIFKYKNKIY